MNITNTWHDWILDITCVLCLGFVISYMLIMSSVCLSRVCVSTIMYLLYFRKKSFLLTFLRICLSHTQSILANGFIDSTIYHILYWFLIFECKFILLDSLIDKPTFESQRGRVPFSSYDYFSGICSDYKCFMIFTKPEL